MPPRDPVPGTVPITGVEPVTPFPYTPANAPASDRLRNPLAMTSESIKRGKDRYSIYCAVCHGDAGQGDGPVAAKMGGTARNLASPPARAYSDGRIYVAIRHGFGLMPAYGDRLSIEDRWNVVNYVRVLQGVSP
jgi:mono/diheme cytochrome c family protein